MELMDQSEIDTWRGAAEEVRFCYGGASPAGGGASEERVRFSGGGVLFRWCFSILEGTAEIFLVVELLFRFLGEEGFRVEAEKLLL